MLASMNDYARFLRDLKNDAKIKSDRVSMLDR
jgi:hypothetical protein